MPEIVSPSYYFSFPELAAVQPLLPPLLRRLDDDGLCQGGRAHLRLMCLWQSFSVHLEDWRIGLLQKQAFIVAWAVIFIFILRLFKT